MFQFGSGRERNLDSGRLEKAGGSLVARREQCFYLPAQRVVSGTGAVEEFRPLLGGYLQRLIQHALYFLPAFRGQVHHARLICLFSQRRAVVQSRLTVAGETPRNSEVSSMDNPPKNRNSTIRPCCGSIRESSSRASSSATKLISRATGKAVASSRTSLRPPSRFAARWPRA